MLIAAFGLPAILATALFALRFGALSHRHGAACQARPHLGAAIVIAGLSTLVAAAPLGPAGFAGGLLLLGLLGLYEACDYTSYHYFGTPLLANVRHLPFGVGSRGALKGASAYLRQYFPRFYCLSVLLALLGSFLLHRMWIQPAMLTAALALALVGVGTALIRYRRRSPLDRLTHVEKLFVDAEREVPVQPLRRALRNVHLTEPLGPLPSTILLIINESVGAHMPAAESRDQLLSDRIRNISGDPSNWFAPANVITNSSCTDISIPSILTGSAPHESVAKLHAMPFIFDLAKARGYRTLLFTSSTLNWAGLDSFLGGAAIDETYSAQSTDRPYINDLTIDDILPARELATRLKMPDGPALAVLYSNALHVPFQCDSECGVPDAIKRRRDRATHIVQEVHRILFEALTASGRYQNALIVTLGDHGETLGNADDVVEHHMARTTDLHDCVVRPMFLIKPPLGLPSHAARALHANRGRLIANLDVAPTVAHLLGVAPMQGLSYAGYSLFEEIPANRIAYLLNTNEWRSWPRGAVGVFRGRSRIAVDYLNDELCRYLPAMGGSSHDRQELLAAAYSVPFLQRAISQIFHDKLGRQGSPARGHKSPGDVADSLRRDWKALPSRRAT